MTPTLRAGLHVHTCHSKRNGTMPFLGSRDCDSTPADVYRVAKSRGMDLVAITDHDSIDGALEARNGTMLAAHNRLVEQMAGRWTPSSDVAWLGMVAGSDAHTLRRVGCTWATAPGRTREEFLSSLRQGLGRRGGRHGAAGFSRSDVRLKADVTETVRSAIELEPHR